MIGRKFRAAAAASTLLAAAAMSQPMPASAETLAVVNGVEITDQDLALAESEFANQLQQIPPDQRRKVLIDVLVDMSILADAAKQEGLDQTEDFKRRFAFLRTRALRNEYFQKKVADSITDADVRARFEEELGKYEAPEEVRARHILVKTEAEAKAIIDKLGEGADFAELAKQESTGPTGPKGGDLGYFTQDRMVKPFADAAFAMESGSHSKEPVESEFGWHVIKVEDRRSQPKPTFEELGEQMRTTMVRERFAEMMAELKANAEIEIRDADEPDDASGESQPKQ